VDWVEAAAILVAGIGAGTINAVVGSGTLITFPTLLAFGFPPVVANISNNIGVVPGGVAATFGYRRELSGQRRLLMLLAPTSMVAAVTGAVLLLALPAEAFARIVPVLLAVSLVLVVAQTRIQRALQRRRESRGTRADSRSHRLPVMVGVYLAGIYGGYFGAAQGVLLVGLLGSLLPETLQRVNAAKNLLTMVVNLTAAVTFSLVAFDRIDWQVVALIATGSAAGGLLGAKVGRRLPDWLLRSVIVVIGVVAIWSILAS